MQPSEIALVISSLALIVSLLSLWVNSLSPFSPKVSHDSPTFALYKISPQVSGDENGRTWWIPSFDLGITFFNSGRRDGEIRDIRLIADLVEPRNARRFYFYPKWLVEYSDFQCHRHERFDWLEKCIIRDWYPFVLRGQSDKDAHVILEGDRWDSCFEGSMKIELQFTSSKSDEWISLAHYDFYIEEEMFSSKSTWSLHDERLESLRKIDGNVA